MVSPLSREQVQMQGSCDGAGAGRWGKRRPAGQVLGGLELGDGSQTTGKPSRHPAGFKSSSATDWLEEVPQPLIPPLDIGQTQQEARGQGHLGNKTVGSAS